VTVREISSLAFSFHRPASSGGKARGEFFGFHLFRAFDRFYEEGGGRSKHIVLPTIINNTVFRLEEHEHGLASRVLATWRERIVKDWCEHYPPVDIDDTPYARCDRTGAGIQQ